MRSGTSVVALLAVVGMLTLASMPASAQTRALIREGDTYNGYSVGSLDSPDTNSLGGWVIHLDLSDPNGTYDSAWGTIDGVTAPSVLFMEGTYGGFIQSSWEGVIGMSDTGLIAYSPIGSDSTGTSLDSVWVNETPYAIEGHPMPPGPLQDLFWTFASRPNITANGMPYFVGGTDDTSGGTTSARGLFNGTGTPVLYTGDELPGLPAPLDNSSPVSFDVRYSMFGSTYITEVTMETTGTDVSSLDDGAMVIDSLPMFIDGSIVREDSPVPASIGGLVDENWDNFDSMWINEMGEYIFTGDTDADSSVDEFVVVNGQIVLREGDLIDPNHVISGSIENAAMNEQGDWAVVWDVDDPLEGNVEALIFNGQLVLLEAVDDVDFDGDGVADIGARIAGLGFSGIFPDLRVSERDPNNMVTLYFVADVSNQGADDIEIFYAMPMSVAAGPAGDLELAVSDAPDPLTTVPGKITYTARVRNNGATPLTGVTVVSTLDGDLAFDAANSDPIAVHSGEPLGGTVTATIGDLPAYGVRAYKFVVDAGMAGEVTTTTLASANEADPDSTNNSATNTTAVGASSDMQVVLSDAPDPVYDPNGIITYTVEVTNNGPSMATGAMATLTLDANTSFISTTLGSHDGSPNGGVVTVDIGAMADDEVVAFDVVVAALSQGTVTADAAASATQDDPVPDNNTASESTLFELTSDLFVAMADTPDPVIPVGGQITYTVDVGNDGPSPATGVMLAVELDDATAFVSTSAGSHDGSATGGVVTVDIGALAEGAPASVEIVVNTLEAGRVAAVATVTGSGNEIDPDPDNNAGPTYTLVLEDAAPLPKGVFSTLAGHATAQVPGLDGAEFDAFYQPFASPNRKLWILSASSNLSTSEDEVIIVGSACGANTLVQEGVTTLDPNHADQVGLIDDELSINDAGSFAFATNTNAASDEDEVIVKYDAATKTFITIAREGDFAAPTGYNYGTSMDSPQITQSGEVWFVADTDGPSDMDDFVLKKNGNEVVAQTDVTIPTGQLGSEPWDTFDTGDMSIDPTGATWALQGDVAGDSSFDDIFAVNNDVKVQEGVILPGSGFTSPAASFGIDYGRMTAPSSWMARGDNDDGQDWVLMNGAVLTATGDPVTPGSAERFSDAPYSSTYFEFAENNLGHFLVAGTTNAADDASNAIIVLDGMVVVSREDDPIDLDGNGLLDDGVRIRTYGNDDLILTDDFQAYVTVTLRAFDDDGSNTDIGEAFIRLNLCGMTSGLCGDLDGDGDVDLGDYDVFRLAFGRPPCEAEYLACADYDSDGLVTFLDYQEWLKCYRAANGEIVRARGNARVEAVEEDARTETARSASPAPAAREVAR